MAQLRTVSARTLVQGPKKQRGGIVRRHTQVTYEDLKRLEVSETRRTDTPKALPRSAIRIADQVFQWRPYDEDMQASEDHVRTLVRELDKGKPLDPVLVVAIGQGFYLVEGHHRMDAYHTAKWKKSIPVEVYNGSLRDARDEAFARNYKDKLPMTLQAKLQAAWVRFNELDLTWNELEHRFRVSNGTIAKMSRVRKALLADNQNPCDVRWRDVLKPGRTSVEGFDYEAHVSKAALEMAEELRKVSRFFKNPEITARAIAMVSPEGAQALADHLRDADEGALGAWETPLHGGGTPEVLEVDIANAIPIVTGQLEASGQGELARRVEDALQGALEEHAARFSL